VRRLSSEGPVTSGEQYGRTGGSLWVSASLSSSASNPPSKRTQTNKKKTQNYNLAFKKQLDLIVY